MPRPTPTPHDHSPTTPETNAVRKLRGPCGESTILIRITRNWKSKRGDQHTIGLRKAKDLQLMNCGPCAPDDSQRSKTRRPGHEHESRLCKTLHAIRHNDRCIDTTPKSQVSVALKRLRGAFQYFTSLKCERHRDLHPTCTRQCDERSFQGSVSDGDCSENAI